jgi:hypothetical protein
MLRSVLSFLSGRRGVRRAPVLAATLAASALAARPAAAQLSFAWADSAPRIERYTTPEECLAAAWRTRYADLEYGNVWRDTMPLTQAEARAPLPAPVLGLAGRCGARFSADTTPVVDYLPVTMLFLLANRDTEAETLVKRRLAAVPAKARLERAAVLDTVIGIYLAQSNSDPVDGANYILAQPARIAMAEPLIKELVGITGAPWLRRHDAYVRLLLAARDAGDTARMQWAAKGVIATVAAIPTTDQRSDEYPGYVRNSFKAMELLAADSLIDSLRRSTASYVALQRANWAKASGERPEALRLPIGQLAPAVQGDFWFRRPDSAAARPTKGKVALVAFLDHVLGFEECTLGGQCYAPAAVLHRVAQRYPDVQITLASRTHGYFSRAEPPTPKAEADTLAHWWLEEHAVPGALAVTATDFWRLPPPDGRRIDRDRANELNYSFGRHWPVEAQSAYLIDRSGIIVGVVNLIRRQADAELTRLLDAIVAQPVASR